MARRKPAPADAKKAVVYVRVSTEDQRLSPDAQRDACTAWASARGAVVVELFEDVGVSGGAPVERCPGLLAALAALETHGAGVLLVAKRDRLARDVVKAALVEGLARKVGAVVESADGVGAGDDPAAQLLRTMVDAFAAYERAMIKQRTRVALAQKRARGERAGQVPYGFRADGKRLEPVAQEQAAIARAKELKARGLSLGRIGTELLADGHAPRRGQEWAATTIARMVA